MWERIARFFASRLLGCGLQSGEGRGYHGEIPCINTRDTTIFLALIPRMPKLIDKKNSAHVRNTQAERSEATRRKIIASALRVLQKEGFQRTNLQDIARGAKVTLGALQHQFKTRQALMEHLVDEVMGPLSQHLSIWPEGVQDLPLPERAEEFVNRCWEYQYGGPNYLAAWSLFFGAKSEAPALFKRINAHREVIDPQCFQHFLTVFPEIEKRHPEPLRFASFIFSCMRGIALMNIFKVESALLEGELASLKGVIIQACSGPSTR